MTENLGCAMFGFGGFGYFGCTRLMWAQTEESVPLTVAGIWRKLGKADFDCRASLVSCWIWIYRATDWPLTQPSHFSSLRHDPNRYAQMKITERIWVFQYHNLGTWVERWNDQEKTNTPIMMFNSLSGWLVGVEPALQLLQLLVLLLQHQHVVTNPTDPAGAESDTAAPCTGHGGDFPPAGRCPDILAV